MLHRFLLSFIAVLAFGTAQAQHVEASDAWARATVAGQKTSGAFLKLKAHTAMRLVAASSPVAGVAEIHEMKMEGDVMRMRAVTGLELPTGQTVELKPGGYHLMLLDLKTALKPEQSIPLTLVFKDAQGKESKLALQVPVRGMAPGAGQGSHQGGHQGHGAQ